MPGGAFATEGQLYPGSTAADPFSEFLSWFVNGALDAGAELIKRSAAPTTGCEMPIPGSCCIPAPERSRATG
jgi:hypothetical protein